MRPDPEYTMDEIIESLQESTDRENDPNDVHDCVITTHVCVVFLCAFGR